MNEPTRTAVALLFDDADLGGQLRAALGERGARIVHEGALAGFDPARLAEADADVVVVNLDDESGDDALDRLSAMFDGDRPRVVFNDAQASRSLDGWDRARWARHLAAKVLAQGDVDPPRPQDARAVEVETPVPVASAPEAWVEPAATATTPAVAAFDDEPVSAAVVDEPAPQHDEALPEQAAAESETLAAELEALLAADAPVASEEEITGSGLKFDDGAALPPLFDGDFAMPAPEETAVGHGTADAVALEAGGIALAEMAPAAGFHVDHLSLAETDDAVVAPVAATPPVALTPPAAPAWALLDDDVPAPPPSRSESGDFGIQKMSAADFLAPEAGDGDASPIEPGLSLELVSLEEAIAPQDYVPHEMVLDDLGAALGRLVVLGATTEGTASVCTFLSALPAGLRTTVLHTQHLAGKPADELVEYFAEHCALPVRQARSGIRARAGEVLVVPTDQQVRLLRDGSVDLQPVGEHAAHAPSIDASFTMAANVFGRDALAIVFAGSSTDAVGGCQAIHDRGGRVWVENSPGEHYDDMVGGVMAERLSQFSGTPHELAARMVEEFQTEGRR